VLFLASLAAVSASAQKQHAAIWTTVQSVTVVPGDSGPVIEIVSSRPLTPTLQTIESPLRLVIDLPDSNLTTAKKRIPFRNEQIKGIRLDQFQRNPPVTRVVIDLAGPILYTWDALGNRLRIRLRTDQTATAKPASVPAFTSGTQPVAIPFSEGSSGTLVEAGSRVASGASVSAKEETAILRLARGGEVRVCPGTTVSVTMSSSGQDLMLGMSTGALEAHYALDAAADSVLTPDFRILFAGPGEFHYALSADSHGNTCVRSLMGNKSSVTVSELMGDRTYQVKPTEQAVFRSGRIDRVDADVPLECGCPPPVPVLRTNTSSTPLPEASLPEKAHLGGASNPAETNSTGVQPSSDPAPSQPALSNGPETAPLAPSKPDEVHIQVEAPLVFSAKSRAASPGVQAAAALPVEDSSTRQMRLDIVVQPPPQAAASPQARVQHRGLLGRIKGFFVAIFR